MFPLALRSPRQMADELYPVVTPAGSPLPVFLTREDGTVRDVVARSLILRTQRAGHVRDSGVIRGGLDLLFTDARIVLTGGRPASDGVLAGHVPLEWIVAVGGGSRSGLFRGNELRLVIRLECGDYRVLTLVLDSEVDVHELAQDVARRTARIWLQAYGEGDAARAWHAVAEAGRLTADSGEFALHTMPEYRRVPTPDRCERLGVPA